MFERSTKVIVIASSTTKNVGARHGSVGYITDCGQPKYIGTIQIGEATVVVAPATILFIRYGFGKERPRYEKKSVLVAFPIFPKPNAGKLSVDEKISIFIKKFKKEKFNESTWYNTKSVFTDRPENMDVCIVAPHPVRDYDLLDCSHAEFEAWFDGIILSHRMRITLDKVANKPSYAIRFPADIRIHFADLRDCAMHKDARMEYLWTLKKAPKLKKVIIETIRMVHCVSVVKSKMTAKKSTSISYIKRAYYTGKTGRIKPGPFYRMFIEDIFNDQAFDQSDALFKSHSIRDKVAISDSVRETKNTLQNIASALSCR